MNKIDTTELLTDPSKDQILTNECVLLWNGGRQKLSSATPSVIRRGLCMVRNQSKMNIFKTISYFK